METLKTLIQTRRFTVLILLAAWAVFQPTPAVTLAAAGVAPFQIAQQAYLKASNAGANDEFGSAVAVSGDTVVVAANGEASNATGVNGNQGNNSAPIAGAAYVFVRNGTNWIQQAYLKASNAEANDSFGWSVAASGDAVVVGAWSENSKATGIDGDQSDNTASLAGAAYVFVRSGTNWAQRAYLKPPTPMQVINSPGQWEFRETRSLSVRWVNRATLLESMVIKATTALRPPAPPTSSLARDQFRPSCA